MIARTWRALLAAAPVRVWALILAAPFLTLFAAWLVLIVWKGPWPLARAEQQLGILGWALLAALTIIAVIITALAAVKVSGHGPGGLALEIDGGEEGPSTSVSVTATATTTPAPAASSATPPVVSAAPPPAVPIADA